ncbi:MAG: TolC family protein [Planctomycetes bacterium]|nr:TolC family protein [Planctomycetota bacterium]
MQRTLLVFLVVLVAAFCLRGCSLSRDSGAAMDTAALKYVAEERAEKRQGEARDQEASHLDGFTEDLQIVDGRASLSLEQAVRRTLINSLDIQVASYSPAIAETDILVAESAFDASWFLDGSINKTDTPVNSFLAAGGASALLQDNRLVSTGIRKPLVTGGNIAVSENLDYLTSNSTFITSPSYATNFMVELTQPLLRDMGLDASKARIYVASHNRDASVEDFRRQVMDVLVDLENTYWELVFAHRDVDVRRRSLELAEEVYRKEQSRAKAMMARKLEVSRARAAVTSRKAELISAENQVRNLSDQLKNLMNDPHLELTDAVGIMPTDEPQTAPPQSDRQADVITAIEMRPELRQLRSQVLANEVSKRYYKNQLLPRLDLSFAWRRNSLGGNTGDAFKDQLSGEFNDYITGLSAEVPIGNRKAEAEHRKSKLELQRAMLQLENHTQDVILEVNTAIRQVETALEEIAATREARIAAKDTLDGEQARYDVGDVTNEELLRAQRDLEEAVRNELRAIIGFNQAIIGLQRAKGTLLDYNNITVMPKDYQQE